MISISANIPTYDIGLDENNNLAMVTDKACVQQDCLLASQMLLGEYPYDTTRGVDYLGTLFEQKNFYAFEESMEENIEAVPNVTSVSSFTLQQVTNLLEYQATIESSYGTVEL